MSSSEFLDEEIMNNCKSINEDNKDYCYDLKQSTEEVKKIYCKTNFKDNTDQVKFDQEIHCLSSEELEQYKKEKNNWKKLLRIIPQIKTYRPIDDRFIFN